MKKVSHIAISRFVLENVENNELLKRRKMFSFGNILPDCKPSFITKRHTMEATEEMVWENIDYLIHFTKEAPKMGRIYSVRLGEICHYIGDYFTFPHNRTFTGTMKEHISYEYNLRDTLKEYLESEERLLNGFSEMRELSQSINSLSELRRELERIHEKYLIIEPSVLNDCRHIVNICYLVVETILRLAGVAKAELLNNVLVA